MTRPSLDRLIPVFITLVLTASDVLGRISAYHQQAAHGVNFAWGEDDRWVEAIKFRCRKALSVMNALCVAHGGTCQTLKTVD